MLRFSIVIVSLNGRGRIAMPLDALRGSAPAPFEVIVVDNGSTDGLSAFVREQHPEVVLVRAPKNLGFAGGNNLGILNAGGDVVLLLNDDTDPEPGWLAPLSAAMERDPRIGAAGCRLLYPKTRQVQHLGGVVHANGLTDHLDWGAEEGDSAALPEREVPYVTGAAMALRREAISEVGMLDEGFWPIYFEEIDWCTRARRAGWKNWIVPSSTVIHHESQTTARFSKRFLTMYHRNRVRYLLKNNHWWQWPRVLRVEAKWMAQHAPWDQLWPCAQAYAWGGLQAVEIGTRRMQGEVF